MPAVYFTEQESESRTVRLVIKSSQTSAQYGAVYLIDSVFATYKKFCN